MDVRLTASTQPDHSNAVALNTGPVEPPPGAVYVRLVLRGDQLLMPAEVTWTLDGKTIPSQREPWDEWVHVADDSDPTTMGGFLYAPPITIGELDEQGVVVAVSVVLTDGTHIEESGTFAVLPAPEDPPRHPVVPHLIAAGASEELAALVERRAGGEILPTGDGAELVARLGEVRTAELREDVLVALSEVVAAVQKRQMEVAEALVSLKRAVDG